MLGKRREISLQVSIAAIFVLLILPALGLVIAFSYHQNARNLRSLSDRFIDRARDEAITATTNFLAPVGATLRLVAELAGTRPGFFRSEDSRNVLYTALTSADQIDALYVSFEDGYHRVVTRIDADRRRSDPRIPARANWHSSWVDPFDAAHRQRHRTFFETWPDPVGGYDVDSDFDPRTLTHYRMAKVDNTLGIADPTINPDTGYPIISLGYPIHVDGKFVGVASANITLTMMSHFLDTHRASRNSITVIAQRLGDVIAHPIEAQGVRHEGGKAQADDADRARRAAGRRGGAPARPATGPRPLHLRQPGPGVHRRVLRLPVRFRQGLGGAGGDADRRLRRRPEGDQPQAAVDDGRPGAGRERADLLHGAAHLAADRDRVGGDPGHPPAGLPRAAADRLAHPRDRPAAARHGRCSTTRCVPSRCSCRSGWCGG